MKNTYIVVVEDINGDEGYHYLDLSIENYKDEVELYLDDECSGELINSSCEWHIRRNK